MSNTTIKFARFYPDAIIHCAEQPWINGRTYNRLGPIRQNIVDILAAKGELMNDYGPERRVEGDTLRGRRECRDYIGGRRKALHVSRERRSAVQRVRDREQYLPPGSYCVYNVHDRRGSERRSVQVQTLYPCQDTINRRGPAPGRRTRPNDWDSPSRRVGYGRRSGDEYNHNGCNSYSDIR